MITWAQCGLQDAASPVIEEFIFFHDFTIVVLTGILRAVGLVLAGSLSNGVVDKGLLEGQHVEAVWTLVPGLILVQIAIPSLLLLYTLDEAAHRALTLKVIGHQWYWSYEYSDFWSGEHRLRFDSYICKETKARLLDVDNRTVLPHGVHTRGLVTRADVLHAWALPSLGVKVDACPGRLNQLQFLSHRPGVYFGQCSEICGANHRFMPIRLEFVRGPAFLS